MNVFIALIAALAVQQADPPISRVNGWGIYDNRGNCSAITSYDGNVTVILSYDHGRNDAWFSIANPAWESIEDGTQYPVTIEFSNDREYTDTRATGFRWELEDRRETGVRMHLLAEEFLADFALAGTMRLRMGHLRVDQLSLRGTREVVQRLVRCAIDSHRRYPPDPFRGRGTQPVQSVVPTGRIEPPRRARANLSGYFSADDYPATALRNLEAGTTGVALTIGSDGRVSGCEVTRSSGSAALDSATCRILRSRARYTPARATDGTPTTGTDRGSVSWTLPAD